MGRQPGFRGWWADHEYHRRNVETGVTQFVGWGRVQALIDRAQEIGDARRGEPTGTRDGSLEAYLMAGGFRASEIVRSRLPEPIMVGEEEVGFSGLRPENVKVVADGKPPHILFDTVMALKGYRKVGESKDADGHKHFETVRVPIYRTFPIPLDEPITKRLLEYLEERRGQEWMFPFTATRAYQIIEETDSSIWIHWWRAQRAAQLAREYGFKLHELMEFFQWKDMKTALRYASMGYGALLEKLPVSKISRVW